MVAFNLHDQYPLDLHNGVHNWSAHTFLLCITNAAPDPANEDVLADLTEISSGTGYTTGGLTLDNVSVSRSGADTTVDFDDEVVLASGGSLGPLRGLYVVNGTPTSPADPIVGSADYGSSITLAIGESTTFSPDASGLYVTAQA